MSYKTVHNYKLEERLLVHIPDGFLDAKVWITTTAAGAGALAYALKRTNMTIGRQEAPKLAVLGAFIFAAQMINFPIAGATSGHFLGGTLAAILFGPWVGIVLMSAVLAVQAFVFQDGGITVLGANILCTGLVGSMAGYAIYAGCIKWLGRNNKAAGMIAAFVAGWGGIVAASAAVGLLLAWSGTAPLGTAMSAMTGWHSLIGIGEGVITAAAAAYLVDRKADAALKAASV